MIGCLSSCESRSIFKKSIVYRQRANIIDEVEIIQVFWFVSLFLCLFVPVGTLIGIYALDILKKSDVKDKFPAKAG